MAQSMRQAAADQYENADQLNRTIAQEAQTDQELESQVPRFPDTAPSGGSQR